jgi:hypothetical protein
VLFHLDALFGRWIKRLFEAFNVLRSNSNNVAVFAYLVATREAIVGWPGRRCCPCAVPVNEKLPAVKI